MLLDLAIKEERAEPLTHSVIILSFPENIHTSLFIS
jgi:hypothetical protein